MPLSRRTLLLAALIAPPARAAAQPATPADLDAAMDDHVAWVLSLFAGGADDLTPADVEARFDGNFRTLVPPEEFIATTRQLADQFGPLTLVEDRSSSPGEFVGLYRSESGVGVMISIAVDPATGLIAGFFITPAALPGGTPAASPAMGPAASPVAAGPVIDDPDAQIAAYQALVGQVRAIGEPAVDAIVAGDEGALTPLLSPELAASPLHGSIADVIAAHTTRQLRMTFAEVGATFFGQWDDEAISGTMLQNGTPYAFELTAETAQRGDLPDGRWTGSLRTGLRLDVTFRTGGDGELMATIDIPEQGIADVELSDVRYLAELAVGDLVQDRGFAPGGASTSYTADFGWGDALLRVIVGVNVESGTVSSMQVTPALPTPATEKEPAPLVAERLPFDGLWWVFWGGDTELQNYHVAYPPQRHACDLVIWKDGATYHGDGAKNEDYWAWSQPALAPVDGEVVEAIDGNEDLEPNTNQANPAAAAKPAGNHVVIKASDSEYVLIAHLRHGSVRVQPGDRVSAGDVLGLVGSSGNSSEPHIHIHAQTTQDIADPRAVAIPLRFASIVVDGTQSPDAAPEQGSFIAHS
jgi:hypothetical protein